MLPGEGTFSNIKYGQGLFLGGILFITSSNQQLHVMSCATFTAVYWKILAHMSQPKHFF
jgi:hypothetical protein